jgi:hypothetical protein
MVCTRVLRPTRRPSGFGMHVQFREKLHTTLRTSRGTVFQVAALIEHLDELRDDSKRVLIRIQFQGLKFRISAVPGESAHAPRSRPGAAACGWCNA